MLAYYPLYYLEQVLRNIIWKYTLNFIMSRVCACGYQNRFAPQRLADIYVRLHIPWQFQTAW